jgi:thiol:disulfide interchange protein DsbD
VAVPSLAPGQKLNPAQWSLAIEPDRAAPGSAVTGRLSVKLDPGWHLYSLTTPRPPIATTISLAGSPAVQEVKIQAPPPVRKFDPNFGVETETYEAGTTFLLHIQLKKDASPGPVELTAQVRYQLCDDRPSAARPPPPSSSTPPRRPPRLPLVPRPVQAPFSSCWWPLALAWRRSSPPASSR